MRTIGYVFKDQDPAVDIFRTVQNNCGMTFQQIADKAPCSVSTLANWMYGYARNPQRKLFSRVLQVMGVETKFTWSSTGLEIQVPSHFRGPAKKSKTMKIGKTAKIILLNKHRKVKAKAKKSKAARKRA